MRCICEQTQVCCWIFDSEQRLFETSQDDALDAYKALVNIPEWAWEQAARVEASCPAAVHFPDRLLRATVGGSDHFVFGSDEAETESRLHLDDHAFATRQLSEDRFSWRMDGSPEEERAARWEGGRSTGRNEVWELWDKLSQLVARMNRTMDDEDVAEWRKRLVRKYGSQTVAYQVAIDVLQRKLIQSPVAA